MKKKILGGIAVLALGLAIAVNVNFSNQNDLSSISLANVEALAVESGGGTRTCYTGDVDLMGALAWDCNCTTMTCRVNRSSSTCSY